MNDWIQIVVPGACVLMLVVGLIARAFFARSRFELRSQVYELLGLATARQMPLGPMFLEAREGESGHRGKLFSELASRFQEGGCVADSLHGAAPRLFGEHQLSAIRSVEGTPLLSSTVQAMSADMGRSDAARHQLTMTLCYPGVLAIGLVLLQTVVYALLSRMQPAGMVSMSADLAMTVTNVFASAVFLICIMAVLLRIGLDRTGFIPDWFCRLTRYVPILGSMTRWIGVERALRTLSACVRHGGLLQDALRSAAHASGHQPTREQFAAVATALDCGESIERAFELSGLPDFVIARVITGSSGTPESFARGLAALSREYGQRFSVSLQRVTRWSQPAILVVFGVSLALLYMSFIEGTQSLQFEALPW